MDVVPRHVAIIMDGNGRWATARGLKRTDGHKKGAEAARLAVDLAKEAGIPYLTLFGFSSENWNRPQAEIDELMELLRYYLKKETAELHKNGARIVMIGDRARLSSDIVRLIENAEEITKDNNDITVIVALSYGGRQDIAYAARRIAQEIQAGTLDPSSIDENLLSQHLMTKGIPDPDLMIRTGGESRVSNFLLWQLAYAELYFTGTLWPDFGQEEMQQALSFFQGRERRYGGAPETKRGQA